MITLACPIKKLDQNATNKDKLEQIFNTLGYPGENNDEWFYNLKGY
jgi:hypothetical protein